MKIVPISLEEWLRQLWAEQDRRNPSEVVHRVRRARKNSVLDQNTAKALIRDAKRG